MAVKGFFWRSSIERSIEAILSQKWYHSVTHRKVFLTPMIGPGRVKILSPEERTPLIYLSVLDREEYRKNPEKLLDITNRVCIHLMRDGYEVRNSEFIEHGPVNEARFVESYEEIAKAFGAPEDWRIKVKKKEEK